MVIIYVVNDITDDVRMSSLVMVDDIDEALTTCATDATDGEHLEYHVVRVSPC